MIVEERLVTYINSLDKGNTGVLDAIEREALDSYVPIIRKEMQSFLKLLLAMTKPARILEVGTAVGFSSILMAEYDPVSCLMTSALTDCDYHDFVAHRLVTKSTLFTDGAFHIVAFQTVCLIDLLDQQHTIASVSIRTGKRLFRR